ncbi:hypothetical protein RB597_008859 [Gaeumannomyces tritici]
MANEGGLLDQFLARDKAFPGELWAWFCIGTVIMILRFVVRLRMVGAAGLAGDDYFMVLTFAFHGALVTMALLIYQYGTNVDLGQAEIDRLSEDEILQLGEGSKYLQVSWYLYTCFLWCIKACALSFYRRLTFCLWQNTWVFKALCWFTFLSFFAVILVISLSCLPYDNNFLVRHLPPPECRFQKQNLVAVVVLNVLTDSAILVLPVPVLRDLRLPWFKKLAIGLLICSGFFVIAAAAVRLAATLDAAPSAVTIVRWGVRECEIGLLALSAPVLRPLFSRKLWCGGGGGGGRGVGNDSAAGNDDDDGGPSWRGGGRSCFSSCWGGGSGEATWDVEAAGPSSADSPGRSRQQQRQQQQMEEQLEGQLRDAGRWTGQRQQQQTGEEAAGSRTNAGDEEKHKDCGGDAAGGGDLDTEQTGPPPPPPQPVDTGDVAMGLTAPEAGVVRAGAVEDGAGKGGLCRSRLFCGVDGKGGEKGRRGLIALRHLST